MDDLTQVHRKLGRTRRQTLRGLEQVLNDLVSESDREVEVLEVQDMLDRVSDKCRRRDVEVQRLGND